MKINQPSKLVTQTLMCIAAVAVLVALFLGTQYWRARNAPPQPSPLTEEQKKKIEANLRSATPPSLTEGQKKFIMDNLSR